MHIFVVDDNSTDRTAEEARRASERIGRPEMLTVIPGLPLEHGWSGKLWALSQGVTFAAQWNPDYLLFTDADIVHSKDSVAQLVSIAEALNCDLTSVMVKLTCETAAEKALIPAFVFFFFMLYPPAFIKSARSRTAGAAGGCILMRPRALNEIGGLKTIRGAVIDDCALARAVKASGGRIWLGLAAETVSTRSYEAFSEVGSMISRTAFSQLNHSTLILLATAIGLSITYLLPLAVLFTGSRPAIIIGISTLLLMTLAYWPMVRFYRVSFLWAFALPLIAAFYMGATIHSAVQFWRGRGGQWKGRVQDARR